MRVRLQRAIFSRTIQDSDSASPEIEPHDGGRANSQIDVESKDEMARDRLGGAGRDLRVRSRSFQHTEDSQYSTT